MRRSDGGLLMLGSMSTDPRFSSRLSRVDRHGDPGMEGSRRTRRREPAGPHKLAVPEGGGFGPRRLHDHVRKVASTWMPLQQSSPSPPAPCRNRLHPDVGP